MEQYKASATGGFISVGEFRRYFDPTLPPSEYDDYHFVPLHIAGAEDAADAILEDEGIDTSDDEDETPVDEGVDDEIDDDGGIVGEDNDE